MTPSNPFNELYLTESTTPERFTQIFSPLMVSDTLPLFQPGNVVLMGIQGTGKSALLNLLKPEVVTAYSGRSTQRNSFPVPPPYDRFISGGINLTRSGAIDFGQRPMESDHVDDLQRLPAYFADFLNYWIVRDLLRSYQILSTNKYAGERLGLITQDGSGQLDAFCTALARKDCWMGSLNEVTSFATLLEKLDARIISYRSFLNYNIDSIPAEIAATKTSVGEPISVLSDTFWETGIVPTDVPFYIRIDQFEELSRLEDWSQTQGLYQSYKSVVHKMLGTRDPKVSYRIGTRRHAWDDAPQMYGTASVIEEARNFRFIDLDDILRKKENLPWTFPKFAEDVFRRRLSVSGFDPGSSKQMAIKRVFGNTPSPQVRALSYSKSNQGEVAQSDPEWPPAARKYLAKVAKEDPLDAKFAEAWIRQKLHAVKRSDDLTEFLDEWRGEAKRWWRKERIEQALLQIAASKRQKLLWSGYDDIIQLSGGNILIFVSICQFIWSGWLRSMVDLPSQVRDSVSSSQLQKLPEISDQYVQDEGIQQASFHWYKKLRADPSGDTRQRFVTKLATFLRGRLLSDKKMSYPGETGFTLPVREIDANKSVEKFLFESAAFGALYDRRHTPKTRARGESIKWYINPILCPYFQLPALHTKEPFYAQIAEVSAWIQRARNHAEQEESTDRKPNPTQFGLFD